MTNELRMLDAAVTLSEIRRHGGLTLRIVRNGYWDVELKDPQHSVPVVLKFRLAELKPFVMVLLRQLVTDDVPAHTQKR